MNFKNFLRKNTTIEDVLIKNGYEKETEQISKKILSLNVGNCINVRRTPSFKEDLFDGFELTNADGTISYSINLEEDSEFSPLARFDYDEENGFSETGYNHNCEKIYQVVDGDLIYWSE